MGTTTLFFEAIDLFSVGQEKTQVIVGNPSIKQDIHTPSEWNLGIVTGLEAKENGIQLRTEGADYTKTTREFTQGTLSNPRDQ
ncbi:hypothetical protein [Thermoactinomyces sp. DSM 45892]|uniref:hypothetical protein n=1 Tax=Thermoactinomyces sp. DSM 45892 TaxID=1882753 RepID=UPI00089D546E|nr:hypothetical protein [Thermoactinomyces sp. DSM 45892]SDY12990.1 hypothetical protein SAMN05444416_10285 [Thermoactinomyces sp. DSM 45892]